MGFLKKIIRKQDFNPKILAIFTNPFYFARKGLYKNIKNFSHHISGKILDVGCGTKPYKKLFKFDDYIGLEYDSPENRLSKNADFFYDGKIFPFKENEFDSIICNEVLEHVFNPQEFLSEIHRVLKKDGKMLLTVPFLWDEHEQPYDYARYSSFGLKHLLKENGFEIVEFRKSVDDITVIFQMINAYIYKKVAGNKRVNKLKMRIIRLLTSVFNLLGLMFNVILPKNADLYLDNIVIVRKKKKC
jgi:SAM-dependent methyltransferase